MRTVNDDLKLSRMCFAYPRIERFELEAGITVIPVNELVAEIDRYSGKA